jgi:hypothetical protein
VATALLVDADTLVLSQPLLKSGTMRRAVLACENEVQIFRRQASAVGSTMLHRLKAVSRQCIDAFASVCCGYEPFSLKCVSNDPFPLGL